jgi:hypothetical protein
MRKAYTEYDALMSRFKPGMKAIVDKLTWKYAAQLIIDATKGNMQHYIPGTYKGEV